MRVFADPVRPRASDAGGSPQRWLLPLAWPWLAAAGLALGGAALQARAADPGQGAPARPGAQAAAGAKPAARPAPPAATGAAAAAPASPNPMDTLRERLATKLGAAPVDGQAAARGGVMRVVARSGADAAAPADAKSAAGGHGAAAPPAAHGAAPAGKRRAPAKAAAHAVHWDYEGEAGPEAWAKLKPEFSLCGSGTRQSPIDIRGGIRVDLDPIVFSYEPTDFQVVNNGHTIQVNLAGGNSIEVMGRRYDLVQFHFHHPSEERINGKQFDMSLHLVHRDPEGRLAVIAVLLDRGDPHPAVQAVWNNLPLEKHQPQTASIALDPSHLLPADRRYYTYMGSLTTPPCTEGVLWMVMQQPVTVDRQQLSIFTRLYPNNARPIQQAAGRLIKGSN